MPTTPTLDRRRRRGPKRRPPPMTTKMRKTGEREFILSPEGIQYMSRVVSVTDMVKRGCREADIEEMRRKLKYEGKNIL